MAKAKGGLGKGLSALIPPARHEERPHAGTPPPVAVAAEGATIVQIEISRIRPNPFQPRADFDKQALDELKESIRLKGIIQPVTVRSMEDGTYQLISGERRIRASQEIGLHSVPCYIMAVARDTEMLELALIENLQREHLNPIEIAISYQRLMNEVGLDAEDVATKVSKDRTTVVNFLRLLKLPAIIQEAVRKGRITMGHARALIALPDGETQVRFYERIVRGDLNVRQVEKLVRDYGKVTRKKTHTAGRGSSSAATSLADRMQQILATKVRINVHEGGRGEILIEFYNNDDLGRLFDLIASIEH